jgi:hypothetical protein
MFQELPPEQKKTYALIGSGIFTLLIFAVWLVFFVQNTYTEKESIVAGGASFYQEFKDNLGSKFGELKENFSSLKSLTTDMIKNIGESDVVIPQEESIK